MKKELLFSLTEKDFDFSYSHGTGCGGQARNKSLSAVHCRHKPSGAHAYSQNGRSQKDNKQDAFKKLTETQEFQYWLKREIMIKSGEMAEIDKKVEQEMKNVKCEKIENGVWVDFIEK